MLSYDLLLQMLRAEVLLFTGAIALLFGNGLWVVLRSRWSAPLLREGRDTLLRITTAGDSTAADVEQLRSLPRRLQIRLFHELAPSLTGSHRDRLSRLAERTGLMQTGAEMCRSRFWWRRLKGVRLLSVLRGGSEIVPALFDDPSPAVRTEAVEWAADHATPQIVHRLLALLDLPPGSERFALRDSLLRIGAAAIDPLAQYLDGDHGPATEPAMEVAAGLPDARFSRAALRLCQHELPRVRMYAASLLGVIGGDEPVHRLQALLDDPDPQVRAAAIGGLANLGHWPAATAIARRLGDSTFVVRREAGLALTSLGGPGLLLLRRALTDQDQYAADMARQILDLPGITGNVGRV